MGRPHLTALIVLDGLPDDQREFGVGVDLGGLRPGGRLRSPRVDEDAFGHRRLPSLTSRPLARVGLGFNGPQFCGVEDDLILLAINEHGKNVFARHSCTGDRRLWNWNAPMTTSKPFGNLWRERPRETTDTLQRATAVNGDIVW